MARRAGAEDRPKKKRTSKYNARRFTADGVTWHSDKEYKRWLALRDLEANGKIHGLDRQVEFELLPKQTRADGKAERSVKYIADFVYTDERNHLVVEDVKGYRGGTAYGIYKIKRKLLLFRYGISITEV